MLQKDRDNQGTNKNRVKFADEFTRKKIGQHLSNINDVITEEDIRNVKTDIGLGQLINPVFRSPADRP